MKEIKLTQGKVALIDDEDFELLSKHRWHVKISGTNLYVATNLYKPRHVTLRMHILIMGKKTGLEIDHVNHNGLDNRRCNLRHVTRRQNVYNKRPHTGSISSYKGVAWCKSKVKWRAKISKDGVIFHLGFFDIKHEAAAEYNKAAAKLYGEFAFLNKIRKGERV